MDVELTTSESKASDSATDAPDDVSTLRPKSRRTCLQLAQQASSAVYGSFAMAYRFEMGTYKGEKVPEIVQQYLEGKLKFEMEPDERFVDYDFFETNSVPPPYSKKTAHKWACCPCYPLCCLPCCFARCCCHCPDKVQTLDETDHCLCCPGIHHPACRCVNKCVGGTFCLTPTCWDFFFESNRSKVLALWNLVICLLLLFTSLNPIGSIYEMTPGCENAFGYRPGLMTRNMFNEDTINVTDLVETPEKYCSPMNLIISLGRKEHARTVLGEHRTVADAFTDGFSYSGGGDWGTCSAIFNTNSVGVVTSLNIRIRMLWRIGVVAAANARFNRFRGWGLLFGLGSLLVLTFSMRELGNDLTYCPMNPEFENKKPVELYGTLDRLLGAKPYKQDLFKAPPTRTPTPEAVSLVTAENASTLLSKSFSFSKQWAVPQVEIHYHVARQCKYELGLYVNTLWKKTSVDYSKWTNTSCTFTYDSATKILKEHGFYEIDPVTSMPASETKIRETMEALATCHTRSSSFRSQNTRDYTEQYVAFSDADGNWTNGMSLTQNQYRDTSWIKNTELGESGPSFAPFASYACLTDNKWVMLNTTLWVHESGVPLTFNTVNDYWRSNKISTVSLLSSMIWPIPQIRLTDIEFPPSSKAIRTNPRSLSALVKDTYQEQNTYARRKGGFWKGVTWLNYLSLYVEFLLIMWIMFKAVMRSQECARDYFTKAVSKTGLSSSDDLDNRLSAKRSGLLGHNEIKSKNTSSSYDKSAVKFLGLPTRIKASLWLSLFMTVGIAWRIGGMWSHLLEGVDAMQDDYKLMVEEPWNTIKPLLNVENLTDLAQDKAWEASEMGKSYAVRAAREAALDELTGKTSYLSDNAKTAFVTLAGQNAASSGAKGLQLVLLRNLPVVAGSLKELTTAFIVDKLKSVLNSTLLEGANTSMLENFVEISPRQLYLGAKSALGPCAQQHLVAPAEDMLVLSTFGFGNKVLQELIDDPQTSEILRMTTEERGNFLVGVVTRAATTTFATCKKDLQNAVHNMSSCLANATMGALFEERLTRLEEADTEGGACDNATLRSNLGAPYNAVSMLQNGWQCGSISSSFNAYVDMLSTVMQEQYEAQTQVVCDQLEVLFKRLVVDYGVVYLSDWQNLLVAQLDTLVNSDASKQILNYVPGIDAQQFRDALVYTDLSDGSMHLGALATFVRDAVLPTDADLSKIDLSLQEKVRETDESLQKLNYVVELLFETLTHVCTAGIIITVVALLALLFQMMLFAMNVYTRGVILHETVLKHFHPTKGYVPSLMKFVDGKSGDDDVNEEDVKPFRLVDLFAMQGREPTRKETALMNDLNSAQQKRGLDLNGDGIVDEEEIRIGEQHVRQAKIAIRNHIAESLQYCTVLSSSSFLATYLYIQMFGYLIYFGLMFVVLVVPFQRVFWIAVGNTYAIWMPILFLIVIKVAVQKCIVERLQMGKGQYGGIPHPRLTTCFDMFHMLLSAIVGWAPALARIAGSFIFTLLLLPRLDMKLPGASIDATSLQFRGVMEAWRIQTEYHIVVEHTRQTRMRTSSPASAKRGVSIFNDDGGMEAGNPSFDAAN